MGIWKSKIEISKNYVGMLEISSEGSKAKIS